MIILVGESASGKSTIEKELVNKHGYKNIVSYTTRSPREGEKDSVDYHYISKDEFLKLRNEGFFAETGEYNGWLYGTAKEDCSDDKVLVATPHGLRQLKRNPELNIISFYINVPRRDRLIKLLQRNDDIDEACRRSLSDTGQFDGIEDEVDYCIENNGYKLPVEEIVDVIRTLLEHNDIEK